MLRFIRSNQEQGTTLLEVRLYYAVQDIIVDKIRSRSNKRAAQKGVRGSKTGSRADDD